jgi:hypothetical protein
MNYILAAKSVTNTHYAPHILSSNCALNLRAWLNRKLCSMASAVFIVACKKPKDHTFNCYFCSTDVSGHTPNKKYAIDSHYLETGGREQAGICI